MKLRHGTTSPFVRKVMVVAHETGLAGRIERIATKVWAPDTDIARDNPLGKIPALILDDGTVLYDSPVICEYLDSLSGGIKLFPVGAARWPALKLQALADGVLDAAIARRHEGQRPGERQEKSLIARHAEVMKRAMSALEGEAGAWGDALTIGQIATGVACGYLDFRFGHEDWRPGRPQLAAWYERFAKRPSMQATVPKE
ncbi:MAG TPA: glutathione S-transferase N-terminal domain-containing protein [Alphaproteobacteria bacterium]|nr:glutathione S-transferase N-terminal domain-containing protein [Alphaproteobacteria bacterium]